MVYEILYILAFVRCFYGSQITYCFRNVNTENYIFIFAHSLVYVALECEVFVCILY